MRNLLGCAVARYRCSLDNVLSLRTVSIINKKILRRICGKPVWVLYWYNKGSQHAVPERENWIRTPEGHHGNHNREMKSRTRAGLRAFQPEECGRYTAATDCCPWFLFILGLPLLFVTCQKNGILGAIKGYHKYSPYLHEAKKRRLPQYTQTWGRRVTDTVSTHKIGNMPDLVSVSSAQLCIFMLPSILPCAFVL